jgi:Diguanylate cyclase, GGDEF domain
MTEQLGSSPRLLTEREFRQMLAWELQRSTRYQDFLSLCLVRLEYPGAPVASLPETVAARIGELLRSTDVLGMIGDDFAVLLIHTPDTEAAMIAKRLHDRLESSTFPRPVGAPPVRVRWRLGLVSFPGDGTSTATLLTLAQARLNES